MGNIFCIGRNFVEHAKELGNPVPERPVVFLKPSGSFVDNPTRLELPKDCGRIDPEVEIIVFIGQDAETLTESNALQVVEGYGVGLDCTAREVQTAAKAKGLPWLASKGRKNFAPVSRSLAAKNVGNGPLEITLEVNSELRQKGSSEEMLFSIPKILVFLAANFGLRRGDIIFTGTPAGVGPVQMGDQVLATLKAGGETVRLQLTIV